MTPDQVRSDLGEGACGKAGGWNGAPLPLFLERKSAVSHYASPPAALEASSGKPLKSFICGFSILYNSRREGFFARFAYSAEIFKFFVGAGAYHTHLWVVGKLQLPRSCGRLDSQPHSNSLIASSRLDRGLSFRIIPSLSSRNVAGIAVTP